MLTPCTNGQVRQVLNWVNHLILMQMVLQKTPRSARVASQCVASKNFSIKFLCPPRHHIDTFSAFQFSCLWKFIFLGREMNSACSVLTFLVDATVKKAHANYLPRPLFCRTDKSMWFYVKHPNFLLNRRKISRFCLSVTVPYR